MKRRSAYWLIISLAFSLLVGCLTVDHSPAVIDTVAASLYLPPEQDFRIVVISDLNSQYGSTEYEPEVTQAIALIPKWQPDLVLCGGDMIAGQKTSLTKSEIESMWAAFDNQIAAPLRSQQIPFGFTIGNHDGSGAIKEQTLIFSQERELAQAYWQQQDSSLNFVDRANFPFYYTFKQHEIFFLVWDASTAEISPQQLDWIEQTLQSSEAQQAKVRIVLGHLPLYPVAQTKNKLGEYLTEGDKLRSLLVENQVLGYVSGHHHVYYPGKINNLELLHAGALGQGARQIINSESLPRKTLTVMDLNLSKTDFTYTTYDATTWQPISLEQLPAFIPFSHGKIWRHDQKSLKKSLKKPSSFQG
ncbi:MAG: metallophosphoesterase [Cyanobacteria bacterium P01_C01_bin.72]